MDAGQKNKQEGKFSKNRVSSYRHGLPMFPWDVLMVDPLLRAKYTRFQLLREGKSTDLEDGPE